jgi:hypothetical protein
MRIPGFASIVNRVTFSRKQTTSPRSITQSRKQL